ncbi:MAG: hypothetical protein A2719_00435 [Candidatus Ryanbacteria bacterium RIFCSPHIGHO2_01_FULL_45_22]|uniref:PKD domain-containing protein n=1 Tax=Candidatus Ryanbacteria bacterium RIFCSPHIGHO2_01_FULL_45_22 TaxID=1802114 RepID=A0A1G2FYK5_9BACT|nr:MAG: hypothetical protein A2719_00435 [Candidatus Ryanbacteria bacterium RIFCSPHIGHO2_01_FULL_45_22]
MKTALYSFFLFLFPFFVSANVVINEIAWMGTSVSANDEWIELYNNGAGSVDLTGWRLAAVDGQPDIALDTCANVTIVVGGYYLFERTDDESVPGITADCIYTGALGNTSEQLQLLNESGNVVDSINATDGWPAGDNTTKETMQRNGGGWITTAATPKKANSSTDSANPPQNTSQANSPNTNSTSSQSSSSPGGADEPYVQPENLPRIKVDAGGDQQAAVGEQVQFRAQAWGLDDTVLENGRYVWNFGDGATYEGQNVGHEYMFPGTYMARLVVSSGKYSAFDDLQIVVRPNTITISEVMPGEAGWIEFQNTGGKSIHAGGWILETTRGRFIIPLGTTIAPQSFVVLSAATTHMVPDAKGDHMYLFYPNGTYANGGQYVFWIPQGKSISNNAGVWVFTEPTPGSPNVFEHASVPNLIQQDAAVPSNSQVFISQSNSIQPPQPIIQEQEEPVIKSDIQNTDVNPIFQSATLADAPILSKVNREVFWFGGSIIFGGLAAVGVVLFRRGKHSTYS